MSGRMYVGLVGTLLLLMTFAQPGWAVDDVLISCEGTESTGGGTYRYQYTLKPEPGGAWVLQEFCVGTEDPDPSNYSFVPLPGFSVSVIPNPPDWMGLRTSGVKTPHGGAFPTMDVESAAYIQWTGYVAVADGDSITFAFYHPGKSVDEAWLADLVTHGRFMLEDDVAGPKGVYTFGPIHAPTPPAPGPSGLSLVVTGLVVLLLGIAMIAKLMRRAEAKAGS